MTTKPQLSLSQTVLRVTGRNLLTVLAGGVAFLFVAMMPARMEYAPAEPPTVSQPSKIERLLEAHDCWVGEAPADVEFPGGVVLAEAGKGPRFYSSDAIVGGALDHIFVEADPTIVAVYGFCR